MPSTSTVSSKSMLVLTTLVSSAAFVSAQNIAGPAGYNAAMPTLSSYAAPQEWAQWTAWQSSAPTTLLTHIQSTAAITTSLAAVVTPITSSVVPTTSAASVSVSVPYENPFTVYLTQTNSLGVVTGMPSVYTSQPSVVTLQPTAGQQTTLVTSASAATTTTVRSTSSSSGETQTTGTRTNTGFNQGANTAAPTFAGGAVRDSITSAGMALIIAALGFSLL